MRKGNVSLRRCLSQAAWAISMMKNNYLSALYRRIAARRGAKRAVMAVAHALLEIAYHMLKRKEDYRELGADHFDRIDVNRIRRPWSGGWNAWPQSDLGATRSDRLKVFS